MHTHTHTHTHTCAEEWPFLSVVYLSYSLLYPQSLAPYLANGNIQYMYISEKVAYHLCHQNGLIDINNC